MQPIAISPKENQQLQKELWLLYMGDNTEDLTDAVILDAWEGESDAWDNV